MRKMFVTGIGTDVGKTVVSAILTEALEADYWKPVQAGDLDNSDSIKVERFISNNKTIIHPEGMKLNSPMSPHAAAAIDNVEIKLPDFKLPITDNNLVVEGAGGLMVPLNDEDLIIDLIQQLDIEVVLVSQNYLGSINHTILSIDALKNRGIKVLGIIFNGEENIETEKYVLNYSGLKCLGRVQQHQSINKEIVLSYKSQFKDL
ncbi:dethiobiotin synthase [Vicingaceae bacterium]|jgi:dethiobiotin synthetase|nr:dethiobiotin synthase [Vicingaceae bacterium]